MSHCDVSYIIHTNHKHHTKTHNSVIKRCVGTNNIIFMMAEILY